VSVKVSEKAGGLAIAIAIQFQDKAQPGAEAKVGMLVQKQRAEDKKA
jgi:hypothetical protein